MSMTGYGKAQAEINGKKVSVEVRSLNSKQLDLSTRISPYYRDHENELRNDILRRMERGKVDFCIYTENNASSVATNINQDLVFAYYEKIEELSGTLNIKKPADPWSLILRLPNVLQGECFDVDEEEWNRVHELVGQAIDALVAFRTQEGEMLYKFFSAKVLKIEELLASVAPYEADRIEKIKARLTDALEKLKAQDYDRNRFEQELIYYLEKLDITEEKTRLTNHCRYFRETMDAAEEAGAGKGKKLGFILQEMGREINTLGSKSNQAEMQRIVVCMKDELEQMKEQVLNVL